MLTRRSGGCSRCGATRSHRYGRDLNTSCATTDLGARLDSGIAHRIGAPGHQALRLAATADRAVGHVAPGAPRARTVPARPRPPVLAAVPRRVPLPECAPLVSDARYSTPTPAPSHAAQDVSSERPYIYHYTFGVEYSSEGFPVRSEPMPLPPPRLRPASTTALLSCFASRDTPSPPFVDARRGGRVVSRQATLFWCLPSAKSRPASALRQGMRVGVVADVQRGDGRAVPAGAVAGKDWGEHAFVPPIARAGPTGTPRGVLGTQSRRDLGVRPALRMRVASM